MTVQGCESYSEHSALRWLYRWLWCF